MLVCRHNILPANDLFICERKMLNFLNGKHEAIDSNFNVLECTKCELYGLVLGMFTKLDLLKCLGIDASELLDFVVDVEKGYLANFYHSFYHAVDVTCVLYQMLTEMEAAKYLTPFNMAGLLIAGLCHDLGHPGLNNLYQVNAKTDLALKYNNNSVLEAHSCTIAMDLITKHKLFQHLKRKEDIGKDDMCEDELRSHIVKMILATDMIFHYDLQRDMAKFIESLTPSPPPSPAGSTCSCFSNDQVYDDDEANDHVECEQERGRERHADSHECQERNGNSTYLEPYFSTNLDAAQRQTLCNVLLHAADLSNTVRPWYLCKRWSDLVVEEFFRQGDAEKRHHLPISQGMDREASNQVTIGLKFGDFVVKPYLEVFVEFLPKAQVFLDALISNHDQWEALKGRPNSHSPPLHPEERHLPFPEQPNINPSGRRISVAAGVVLLPEDYTDPVLKLVSLSNKMRRTFSTDRYGMPNRAYSHQNLRARNEKDMPSPLLRRKSEEPRLAASRLPHHHHHHHKHAPPVPPLPVTSPPQKKNGRSRRSSSLDMTMVRNIKTEYSGEVHGPVNTVPKIAHPVATMRVPPRSHR